MKKNLVFPYCFFVFLIILFPSFVMAQSGMVKGKMVTEAGLPLDVDTVLIKNSGKGVFTNSSSF